jgi:DNA-binding IscR family transcriptional regulator
VREHIGLLALVKIARRYLSDLPPYRLDRLAASAGLPVTILEDLVDAFVARGILARATEPEGLVLARPPEHLLVVDILDVIRGPAPPDVPSEDNSINAVVDILRKRDEVLRDALRGVTLRTLASSEIPAPDTTVTQFAQYRRR